MEKTNLKFMHISKENFRRWLKIFHLVFASLWGGGSVAIVVIMCVFHPENADQLYAEFMCLHSVDFYVIGVGALGCFVTALLYGAYTSWGFTRHWWLIVKWITLLSYIIIGIFVFMPWLDFTIGFAKSLPPQQPLAGESIQVEFLHTALTLIQLAVVIFMIVISIKKPWGLRKEKASR